MHLSLILWAIALIVLCLLMVTKRERIGYFGVAVLVLVASRFGMLLELALH